MILCLETATPLCSVALCDNSGVVALRESSEGKSHASLLTVFIKNLLENAGIRTDELDAVGVSKGPGSYTGLRIGVSAAKGIAYGSSIPLIGVETTLSMFFGFLEFAGEKYTIGENDLFCPALDARRMEIYYALYDMRGNCVKSISAEIMESDSLSNIPEARRIFFFGDGAAKCRQIIKRKNIVYEESFKPSSAYMYTPVYKAFNEKNFEDVAYFEPFYLKDFLTSKPARNILGK